MRDDPIDLLKQLVAIDSVNPDLVAGGAGEPTAADFCARWFTERGFDVERLEARAGRPSIVAIARGTGGGQTLLFDGHLDIVGVAGYRGNPFDPREEDGRIYGRGSMDMKSGVAAMMVAATRAKAMRLPGDIIVACVADEEYGSIGTEEVARKFKADAAVIPEPTELALTIAHKGFAWFELLVEGKSAHGSRPDLGVDAIREAGYFLVELDKLDRSLREGRRHSLVGPASIHASLISGGQELSSYPAACALSIERRTIPGETPQEIEGQLRAILSRLAAERPSFKATLKNGLTRHPLETPEDSAIVGVLAAAAKQRLGAAAPVVGFSGWTDCALLSEAGIPAILFGPSGEGLHGAVEWVDRASVEAVTDILTETARAFCSSPKAS